MFRRASALLRGLGRRVMTVARLKLVTPAVGPAY